MWRLHDKVSEKPRTQLPPRRKRTKSNFSTPWRFFSRRRLALILTIGFACLIFVLQGYLTWTPTFLHEKFGMDLARAGFNSMFYTHIAAFVGILLAGRISDKLAHFKPAYRILMQSCGASRRRAVHRDDGLLFRKWTVYLGLAGFGFARAFFDANTYPVLYDVIPPKFHASAAGVMLFLASA